MRVLTRLCVRSPGSDVPCRLIARYYPFHYAPCASDAVDLKSINVKFSLGKPFLPFQQLLAVLPAASCKHLPKPYHWLFTEKSSPILDFYPTDFEVDFEGKRSDWEVGEGQRLAAPLARNTCLGAHLRQRLTPAGTPTAAAGCDPDQLY